jgi:hypothetical protein
MLLADSSLVHHASNEVEKVPKSAAAPGTGRPVGASAWARAARHHVVRQSITSAAKRAPGWYSGGRRATSWHLSGQVGGAPRWWVRRTRPESRGHARNCHGRDPARLTSSLATPAGYNAGSGGGGGRFGHWRWDCNSGMQRRKGDGVANMMDPNTQTRLRMVHIEVEVVNLMWPPVAFYRIS